MRKLEETVLKRLQPPAPHQLPFLLYVWIVAHASFFLSLRISCNGSLDQACLYMLTSAPPLSGVEVHKSSGRSHNELCCLTMFEVGHA